MEVSGQLHAPKALPLGKNILYPSDWRLGGPRKRLDAESRDSCKGSKVATTLLPQLSRLMVQRINGN